MDAGRNQAVGASFHMDRPGPAGRRCWPRRGPSRPAAPNATPGPSTPSGRPTAGRGPPSLHSSIGSARRRRPGLRRAPDNWGEGFTVGAVPVFKYLESQDIDEVGYTLRTASLMTDPEYFFDDRTPATTGCSESGTSSFPPHHQPPVPARLTMRSGAYWLWTIGGAATCRPGWLSVRSREPDERGHPGAFRCFAPGWRRTARISASATASSVAGRPRCRRCEASPPPACSTRNALTSRRAGRWRRSACPESGVAVLSASYDPGGRRPSDCRPQRIWMVAPALVAVDLPAGTDHVAFRFRGYGAYPALLALAGGSPSPWSPSRRRACGARGVAATPKERRVPLKVSERR